MLVLFDLDGTLVDSQDLLYDTHVATFSALGLPVPARAAVLGLIGLSLRPLFEALVGRDGPVDALCDTYRREFQVRVADPAFAEPLFPGAREALARIAGVPGRTLGICTGKSRRGVARILDRQGWGDVFATVQTADDAPSKPHPAMVLQAMRATGRRPDETVFIGDTTYDMAMARDAGCRGIGVAWGHHAADALLAAGAGEVIKSFDDLLP